MGKIRPQDIEIMRDPITGIEATIQRDRQRKDYCAHIEGEKPIRGERASDLERRVRAELALGVGLEWSKAIAIEPGVGRFTARCSRVGTPISTVPFAISRIEVATRSRDNRLLARDWPLREIDDDLPMGLNPPDTRIVSLIPMHVILRDYSDATWRSLCEWVDSNSAMLLQELKIV